MRLTHPSTPLGIGVGSNSHRDQLDILVRILQAMAGTHVVPRAPPSLCETDIDASTQKIGCVRSLRGRLSVYITSVLGSSFVQKTAATTYVGRFLASSNTWYPTV